MFEKKNILGVWVTNATQEEILEYIVNFVESSKKKLFIATPNPEFLVHASHHPDFKAILNRADLALNDGVGVVWASKLLKKPLKARVTGVDLMVKLCEKVHDRPITVGFLGGRIGVAERAAECLAKKYPGLKVVFAVGEWEKELKVENGKLKINSQLSTLKSQFMIDILFVAFGFPKQEEWISKNLSTIPVQIAMGVGGAFDYISGDVPRPPKFIQKIGFEWLFRLIVQPWRIKRQLALIEFVWLVILEAIARYLCHPELDSGSI